MPKKAGWLAAAIFLLVANIALARLGGVIKTRLATMVAVLALMLALPAVAETQMSVNSVRWIGVRFRGSRCSAIGSPVKAE